MLFSFSILTPLPPHLCFWAKSAESPEKKRVEFSFDAKKRKRVRKNLRRKEWGAVASDEVPPTWLEVNQNGNCWVPACPREAEKIESLACGGSSRLGLSVFRFGRFGPAAEVKRNRHAGIAQFFGEAGVDECAGDHHASDANRSDTLSGGAAKAAGLN